MPKIIDWPPIEQEYVEKQTPVTTLAKAYGITPLTLMNHMTKYGIVRNPAGQLATVVSTPETLPKVERETTNAELKALREAVIGKHRAHIDTNLRRLEMIAERLDNMTGLSNVQRLNALQQISKISEVYIKLERQAHNIVEEAPPPPPPVAIQVNVNLDPHEAYLQLIGKK